MSMLSLSEERKNAALARFLDNLSEIIELVKPFIKDELKRRKQYPNGKH